MAVRKETQQTGLMVNHSAYRNVSRALRALSAILAMVLTMALLLLYVPTHTAFAEDGQQDTLTIDSGDEGFLRIPRDGHGDQHH